MLDKKFANAIIMSPSSDTTVHCRVCDMARDVAEKITENITFYKRSVIRIMNWLMFLMKPSCLYTFGSLTLRKGLLLMNSLDVNNYQDIQREKIFLKALTISYSWN
jgi:hypothetical protein